MDLNQITIPSLNVKDSMVFYKKLGLILIVEALPRYVRFECPMVIVHFLFIKLKHF